MKKSIIIVIIWAVTVATGFALGLRRGAADRDEKLDAQKDGIISTVSLFRRQVSSFNESVVSSIPAYNDYATPALEHELRTYLNSYHLDIARRYGILIETDEDIFRLIEKGSLAVATLDDICYYYGVPHEYRYLTPLAVEALEMVGNRFQENLALYGLENTMVKIAVSSTIRPQEYQQKLRQSNINAALESTHSYGVSFDIFYDDFYVSFVDYADELSCEISSSLSPWTGFMMGDALRRQFRTVLARTLLELQREGVLYVILEYHQKVYHVTFTETFAGERGVQ